MTSTVNSSTAAAEFGEKSAGRPARFAAIDRLRGLAIVLMIGDHLAIFTLQDWYRVSLGRVAMPLFFILSGYLVTRFTRRHALVGVAGLLLPFAASWVDSPNVLVWYCAGAFILSQRFVRHPLTLAAIALLGLLLGANGYAHLFLSGYNPWCLLAIMALGALLREIGPGLELWQPAARLPRWLGMLGRYPLSWYLGHVLFLTAVVEVVRAARS